jgi:hypothetical protein
LWRLLDHAINALSRTRELELARYNLTLDQAAILHTLISEGGSSTFGNLVNSTNRRYNSVTALVQRMIKQGLIHKKRIVGSKNYKISISKKGICQNELITINSIKMAFSIIPENDKDLLTSSLSLLINNARKMMGVDKKLPFLPQ